MILPASFDRVLALLKRISPTWPSLDADKSTGKEMGSIAVALAMAADAVDAIIDEVFPDTTTVLLSRWEQITRVATRTSDDLSTRRGRVLSVLRRLSGPRIAQLEKVLTESLAIDPSDMVWVEQLRFFVEQMLTETTGAVTLAVPTTAPGLTLQLGKPWPGVVDGAGVQVYLAFTANSVTHATLTSPRGTVWTFQANSYSGWYFTRNVFTGEPAGGLWTLAIYDILGPTLNEFRLLVSNDVDSGAIYQFFVLRDPGLAGTADLTEAQRLFHHTALGNMQPRVVETLAFLTDDPYSLTDRDPLGA